MLDAHFGNNLEVICASPDAAFDQISIDPPFNTGTARPRIRTTRGGDNNRPQPIPDFLPSSSVNAPMRIRVDNIPYTTKRDDLLRHFRAFGQVSSVHIVTDRDTGKPRGFAFVEMPDDLDAQQAIAATHGKVVDGRRVTAAESTPHFSKDGRFGARGSFDQR